jgi:acetoin utilization deacetylase AcuC-like enzyme
LAEEFKPELLVSNGGSDPHFADMLGSLALTVQGFFYISRTLVETANKVCNGKLVVMPGSGYNPAVLPQCWYALAAGVAGLDKINVKETFAAPVEPSFVRSKVEETLGTLKKLLKSHWKCFR